MVHHPSESRTLSARALLVLLAPFTGETPAHCDQVLLEPDSSGAASAHS